MGGQIFVESHLGEGSVFTVEVELPLSMEADDELCDRTDAQDSRNIFKGRRFLLVEDNELNCEIASQLLEVSGAAVECAPNGAEGVKAFEEKEPGYYDAIFMDIQMPVMDGYTAASAIRSLGKTGRRPDGTGIPIIALTANAFADDVYRAKQAGMDEHVTKPLEISRLLEIMHRYLGGPGRNRTDKSPD